MYQKLRYINGIQKTGISCLEVLQDSTNFDYKQCTQWITIDTPQEIESKLRERNQRHFGQAHGAFPTVPPFSEWVDWGASSHISKLILKGTFQPPEVDSLTRELLQHMKRHFPRPNTGHSDCCRTWTKDAINPMTTQRTQKEKQKPHRGAVSAYIRQVH